jgi:hypothetical protein
MSAKAGAAKPRAKASEAASAVVVKNFMLISPPKEKV